MKKSFLAVALLAVITPIIIVCTNDVPDKNSRFLGTWETVVLDDSGNVLYELSTDSCGADVYLPHRRNVFNAVNDHMYFYNTRKGSYTLYRALTASGGDTIFEPRQIVDTSNSSAFYLFSWHTEGNTIRALRCDPWEDCSSSGWQDRYDVEIKYSFVGGALTLTKGRSGLPPDHDVTIDGACGIALRRR